MANGSQLADALEAFSPHRDVVQCYFVKSAGVMIVTGLTRTHGGAAILDRAGAFKQAYPSKSAALAAICNSNNN